MGDWRGRGGAVQRDFGLEDTPLALEARVRSPLQAPASAGNDEARRQQMIRERAVEVRLRARVPRTRLTRASHAPAHCMARTCAQRREAAGHRGAYRRARHTLCGVRSASMRAAAPLQGDRDGNRRPTRDAGLSPGGTGGFGGICGRAGDPPY